MQLKESYVIWNNKGGVGKTTLTFHIATEYAKCNLNTPVLVIDLCPQANVSMALLSTRRQCGSTHLHYLYTQQKTVSSYLQRSIQPGPVIKASDFLTRVEDYNKQVPHNLFLLCGDMYLELVGRSLEYQRSGIDTTTYRPWLGVTSSIRSFIEGLPDRIVSVTKYLENVVVFIDTNPAFSVYTEIALAGARKLLIPINADDFSVEAVRRMLDLVYGIHQEMEDEPEEIKAYRAYMFSSKADSYKLRRPKIHLLINNRTTHYKLRSAKAFEGIAQETLRVLYEVYKDHQQCFAEHKGQLNLEEFRRHHFIDIQDFHSAAVLCLHTGCSLAELPRGIEIRGTGEEVNIEIQRVEQYVASLDALVKKL